MLKKIFYLTLSLIIFGITFSLLGNKDEYVAQRKLFFAEKLFAQIVKNPGSMPSGLIAKNVSQYRRIIEKLPKTNGARKARLILGELYILARKTEGAREELGKILKDYAQDKSYCAQALLLIGKSYERENKWGEALSTYESIIENYTQTPTALNMPIYIVSYYEKNNDTGNKNAYLKKAREYYKKLSLDYANKPLGYLAANYEIVTLQHMEDWLGVLGALTTIINTYPNDPNMLKNLKSIEIVAMLKLKQPQLAIDAYSAFMKKYPQHNLNKIIAKEVDSLKNKEENKNNDNRPNQQ